jgi:hypothetical protein
MKKKTAKKMEKEKRRKSSRFYVDEYLDNGRVGGYSHFERILQFPSAQ